MKQVLRKTLIGLAAAAGVAIAALVVLVAVWYFRPNASEVDPALTMELGVAVSDGMHNSNTDMTFWKGHFYLVHAHSKYHMGNEGSSLRVLRSADAKSWTMIHEVRSPGEDVRDPKIVVMNGRLVLYVLVNRGFEPEPHGTAVTMTADGKSWTALEPVTPEGWLLWRPKSRDGRTWYVTAYWKDHGKSILLSSRDGLRWDTVSTIHEGDRNDETAMEFLPDGRLIATARLEGTRSWHQGAMDASTLIAVAAPPYTKWTATVSRVTRLDGPVLFRPRGKGVRGRALRPGELRPLVRDVEPFGAQAHGAVRAHARKSRKALGAPQRGRHLVSRRGAEGRQAVSLLLHERREAGLLVAPGARHAERHHAREDRHGLARGARGRA